MEYLDAGHHLTYFLEAGVDVVTGQVHRHTSGCSSLVIDGVWVWRADFAHYLEAYHVLLPAAPAPSRLVSCRRFRHDGQHACHLLPYPARIRPSWRDGESEGEMPPQAGDFTHRAAVMMRVPAGTQEATACELWGRYGLLFSRLEAAEDDATVPYRVDFSPAGRPRGR
ncbi:hypothetical protein [Streptomyces pseudovenezuelae]|uniref:hypothetical protein n=1 Tax=Streptomyces pseudovenezuelae TaxID=67350 RepID=UPI002E364384|nr:hypothetical protein [Streptomyces pseudovenezuelae]